MATRFPASATWLLMAGFYRIRSRVEMGAIVSRRFDDPARKEDWCEAVRDLESRGVS
jgi:hypothetical protein